MFFTQSGLEGYLRGMKNVINTMKESICPEFCLEYSCSDKMISGVLCKIFW
jgi:hypothetical protein